MIIDFNDYLNFHFNKKTKKIKINYNSMTFIIRVDIYNRVDFINRYKRIVSKDHFVFHIFALLRISIRVSFCIFLSTSINL